MEPKFTTEFLEERMRRHHLWLHQEEHKLIEEIIEEVQMLPRRKPRGASEVLDFGHHAFGQDHTSRRALVRP